MTCNHCQDQLLHYIYEVLEPEERAQVAQHLDECAVCQAAQNAVREQQDLLVEAAKESFSAIAFQPPAETPKRLPEPTLSMPRRQRGFSWVRVAVAASIVVFVLGGGMMGVSGWLRTSEQIQLAESRVQKTKQRAQDQEQNLVRHKKQTQEEIKAIKDEIDRVFKVWSDDASKVRTDRRDKPAVRFHGPQSTPAGAQTQFNIDVNNLRVAKESGLKESALKGAAAKASAVKESPAKDPPPEAKKAMATAKGGAATVEQPGSLLFKLVDQANNKVHYEKEITEVRDRNNELKVPPLPIAQDVKLRWQVEFLAKDGTVQAREEGDLSAPEYLTHLTTDRPMYRPGEWVRFRSLTLERFSLKPPQEDLHLVYRLLGPNEQEVGRLEGPATLVSDQDKQPLKGPDGKVLRGVGAGEFHLSPDLPGGQYTVALTEAQNRFPAEKRAILVNQWQMPRMNKELKFHRSSYGPGELVEINAVAKRAEGGALAGHVARIRASVDDNPLLDVSMQADAEGKVRARFPLPAAQALSNGHGSVSVEFNDGAGPETIVRPIPIVLNKLFIEFFPEGGDLVQGVTNRVYFQAKNTMGKPAEVKGRIVDQMGNVVAAAQTLNDDLEEGINQGQGAFDFVPAPGKSYELKIDTPIGIQGRHVLPATKPDGVVLRVQKPVAEETIECEVTSANSQRSLMVGAYCRGRLIDERRIGAPAGKPQAVTLNTAPGVQGVYRVTVYEILVKGDDLQFVPRAERLTYRKGTERVHVALEGQKNEYAPGEKVQLRLKAQDENKQKLPVVGLVSVVDLSLIKLADDKTERTMPTHFLLTTEIKKPEDFENADVLLGTHPKAETAVDLLLGTQGWRRFAEQDPKRFQERNQREAPRIIAGLGQTGPRRDSIDDVVKDRVDKPYAAKAVELLDQLAKHEAEELAPANAEQERRMLQSETEMANRALSDAQAARREYESRVFQYVVGALVIGALLLGLGAIVVGVRRMGQGRPALASFITGTSLLLFLFMSSLAGVFYMIGSKGDLPWADRLALQEKQKAEVNQGMAMNVPPPAMNVGPAPAPGIEAVPQDAKGVGLDNMQQVAPAPPPAPNPAGPEPINGNIGQGPEKRVVALNAPPLLPGAPPGGGPRGAAPAPLNQGQQPGGFPGNFANNALPPGQNLMLQGDAQFRQDAAFGGRGGGVGGVGNANLDAIEREERQRGNYEPYLSRRMQRQIAVPQQLPSLVVRVYTHEHAQPTDAPKNQQELIRRDFTETVCWQPALIFPDGQAQIAFDLSDAVTRYQVTVFSHSLDGRLGADRFEIAARLPYSIDPKVPFEVSSTDKLVIPVAVKNDSEQQTRVELVLRTTGLKGPDPQVRDAQSRDVFLEPKGRDRALFSFEPALSTGEATLRVKANFLLTPQGASDTVERSFRIAPDGFPLKGSHSGLLEKAALHDIVLPNTWVPGTLKCEVQLYPSTLAELQKGLEGLLREPCGCFEQSSSSNYPNVLILNYLQESGQGDPNVEKRARALLQSGYQKLTSFECLDPSPPSEGGARGGATRRGYEWFGQTAPPHESLTAYGLLQFRDMARIYNVDKDMVERTTKYLLEQRDGQGGFKRNARALDSFGRAPEHITNAYIVWALTDAAPTEDLSKELAALQIRAKDSKDPYFVALATLGHLNSGKSAEALALAKRLSEAQKNDGHLEGTETSITGSQGRDLHLETTALAVLAWLKANRPEEFHTPVEKAVKWISAQRSGQGSFGATQSTILALKALIAHARDAKKVADDGKLTITLPERGQAPIGETSYTAGTSEPITLTLIEGKGLLPGKNKVLIETTGKTTFPYTLSWSYQTLTPPSDAGCAVKLSARLNKLNVQEGDTVKLKASVENMTDKGHGMTVAILGLPAGLTIPEDAKQLKEMARLRDNGTKPGLISHWELKGRELILYWRDLAPKAKVEVDLDLISRLPGTYRGPASRAYLYYNADQKHWVEPLQVAIDPQRE